MPDKANPRDLSGTIVAFDFGLARIGAAVGNTLSRSARPVRIFPARMGTGSGGGRRTSPLRRGTSGTHGSG